MSHPLKNFLTALSPALAGKGRVSCLSRGTVAPPPLSFLVNFPIVVAGVSGAMRFRHAGEGRVSEGVLRRGDLLVVPGGCWYEVSPVGDFDAVTLLFGPRSTGLSRQTQRDGALAATAKAALPGPPSGAVSELPPLLESEAEHGATGVTAHLARALAEAVADNIRKTDTDEPGPGSAKRLYANLAMYVQKHCHTDLTREGVAREFRISPNHLSRLFREAGLVTYVDYLNYARIHRAKFLLRKHPMSVGEVAANAGFRDTAYFCRVFRKVTKTTPSRYRADHREG